MTVQAMAGGGLPPIGRKAACWVQEMRLPFLTVSVLPVIFGTVAARAMRVPIDMFSFVLALAAAVLVHIGANVINDYFDARNGTDTVNKEFVHGFTGGSRVIQEGLLTAGEVLSGALLFLSAGFLVTLYLADRTGHPVLFMGIVAVIAAVTYSLFLHSLYLGELIVGLCFGTLIPAGSFYVQAGYVAPTVLLASVPMGLLVFLILLLNEIPDYTADRSSGKKTLVVRLGRRRAAYLYAATLVVAYAWIAVTALKLHLLPLLFSFLTLPVAFGAAGRVLRCCGRPAELRPGIVATIALFTANSLVIIIAFALKGA